MIGWPRFGLAATVAVLALCAVSASVEAHAFRPTLLRAELASEGPHRVTWKWDGLDPRGIPGSQIDFPGCDATMTDATVGTERLSRFAVDCGGGPVVARFEQAPVELVLDIRLDGEPIVVRRMVGVGETVALSEFVHEGQHGAHPTAVRSWLRVGAEHILFGWDHLCFVIALALLVGRWRRVASVVTGFTLGHSVTLVATTLGWLTSPSSAPVEATIALSILYLAVELTRGEAARERFGQRLGFWVATGFGLVHGFGFAGALSELALPDSSRGWALAAFNVGVELGQLGVVALVLIASHLLVSRLPDAGDAVAAERWAPRVDAMVRTAVAYVVGAISTYWLIGRTIAILTP